jgi:hypothetical protein
MQQSDKPYFDSILNRLSDQLHTITLSVEASDGYWKALSHLEVGRFLRVVEHLSKTYKPRWMSDFPVLKDFFSALQSMPIPDSEIFHSFPCRCCDVRPHGDGKLACQCDLARCFQCFHCGQCCKCQGGPIPLEELPEWKEAKAALYAVKPFSRKQLTEQK